MNYSVGLREHPAAEGPQFTLPVLSPHAVARTPVAPATALDDAFIAGVAFAKSVLARRPQATNPEQVGRVTKLQHSLNATAWRDCLPCSGQDFYDRACMGPVARIPHVGYHWMAHRHLPSPDLHRLDCQYYGLRTDFTDRKESV